MYQVQLQSKGHEFTVKEVINKMKKTETKVKNEKKNKSRKSGNGTAKNQWKYFSKIDSLMSRREGRLQGKHWSNHHCQYDVTFRLNEIQNGAQSGI